MGPSTGTEPTSTIKWRLLIHRTGAFYLYEVSLLATDRGPDVVERLFRGYRRAESLLAMFVPFLIPTLYMAKLAPVTIETLASFPCLVNVDTQPYSHPLTTALPHPTYLPATPLFLPSYARFAVIPEPPDNTISRDAILVKVRLSKLALLVFLTLTFAASVIIGVVAGVVRHSLDLGFGVFGAIVTVVGLVEGYATWRLS
ncbi:uncharacterized protein A1O5_03251 [Cladophialophora psammophila CBS 110553]|uniref:Uncharacterized protein n=1 Tax=Cladophialophora psammophila CBS 110553 TaxID=1182543 RepID=W9X836_9EURO|nr:uncharacterized protein A1O5_03251 [Cladophialophora psammophila CBS 110553]EXJ73490.1 hypothetical protein A1O5_03251 [Cladophialophora psammophila CBS 110553]